MPTTAPTGRDLDAALARLIGWTDVRSVGVSAYGFPPGGFPPWETRPARGGKYHVPDYSSSLDAMAEVEAEIGRRGLKRQYVEELCRLCAEGEEFSFDRGIRDQRWMDFKVITAPPELRAAAAFAVLSEGRG